MLKIENPPHIFISYSSKDRSLVEKILLALEAAVSNVWREQTRLETHTDIADWSREIAFALADGDVVCLMWSQHAAAANGPPEKSKKDKKRKRKK